MPRALERDGVLPAVIAVIVELVRWVLAILSLPFLLLAVATGAEYEHP